MKYRPVSGKAVTHPRREERRVAAAERAQERAVLTDEEQLRWLDQQGYRAVRERARLWRRIAESAQR